MSIPIRCGPIRRVLAVLAALVLPAGLSPALAQAAASSVVTGAPGEAVAIGGTIFELKGQRYQVTGLRAPRIRNAACAFERKSGREALKVMRRALARGEVVVRPTGSAGAAGSVVADVLVRNKPLRTELLKGRIVRPSISVPRGVNPWCLGGRSS